MFRQKIEHAEAEVEARKDISAAEKKEQLKKLRSPEIQAIKRQIMAPLDAFAVAMDNMMTLADKADAARKAGDITAVAKIEASLKEAVPEFIKTGKRMENLLYPKSPRTYTPAPVAPPAAPATGLGASHAVTPPLRLNPSAD